MTNNRARIRQRALSKLLIFKNSIQKHQKIVTKVQLALAVLCKLAENRAVK